MRGCKVRLVLTGARAGKTCTCGKFQAVNGVITLWGEERTVRGQAKYLGLVFAAFPEEGNGNGALCSSDGSLQGSGQSEQSGFAQALANLGVGSVDPAPREAERVPIPPTRYEHNRLDRIKEVVMALDHSNDRHWTTDGLPRVDYVAEVLDDSTVTRRDLEKVAPDLVRVKE